ncbi:signal recognition particle protein Srp19 [Candidatus Bathyarchaeota archaeon]|nr:signal recognition particle protein Srp19 [Candidatus Bathyarchaeota archaeon]
MRKLDKFIIWPAYFNSANKRQEGRRVPKEIAVKSPRLVEIQAAVDKLGLKHELVLGAGYPKTPWVKTGMIMVEKKGSKEQVIKRISGQLLKIRSETTKQK